MELLDLVPNHISYEHARNLVENLQFLRPDLIQVLLETCTSVKIKRLFLHLADELQLPSFEYLDVTKIGLGKGKRIIGGGGKYIPKYQLSVPQSKSEEEGVGYV